MTEVLPHWAEVIMDDMYGDDKHLQVIKPVAGAPNDNFRKNICSEDDLRSRIFETFFCKISCLSASPRIFEHVKNGMIAYF